MELQKFDQARIQKKNSPQKTINESSDEDILDDHEFLNIESP